MLSSTFNPSNTYIMNLDLSIPTASTILVATDHNPRRRFLTPLSDPGEFLLVLDNTAFGYITSCPRSAEYYLLEGRESQVKGSALVFGGAIHAGLETYLKGGDVDSINKAVVDYFADHPAPINDHRTPANALEVLRHYLESDTFERKFNILSDAQGPLIERSFELPLCVIEVDEHIPMPWLSLKESDSMGVNPYVSRIHVAWSGRIDVIAHTHGSARVVDHKTSIITDSTTIADFHLSNQTRGYVWAAQQLWPELDISGFCVNFLSLKKPTGTGGLMSPGPRGGQPPLIFSRNYFDYSPELISEWELNAKVVIQDFLFSVVRNFYPQHTKSCCGRFALCQYHPVCTSSPERRQSLLNSDALYRPVTWNPTNGK